MKVRTAILSAATAMLSMATFSAPASAQYYRYHNYSRTMTRCDRDGDRCATYRCDWDGDSCRRISGWYRPAQYRHYSYGYDRRHYGPRPVIVRVCDNFGYCHDEHRIG